jgi:hypothetical protein
MKTQHRTAQKIWIYGRRRYDTNIYYRRFPMHDVEGEVKIKSRNIGLPESIQSQRKKIVQARRAYKPGDTLLPIPSFQEQWRGVEKRRRPVLGHGGTLLLLLGEIVILLNLGMVSLRVSLIDERRRMERLLIVDWMMHLKGVAMRMILGKCEILVLVVLLLLRME